jgi:DNA-binding transcriptional MerR regulator
MYTISEVGKLTELTPRSLRHYEEMGLITPSRRGSNGYRYYSKDILTKILEIKKYKMMDFSLEEINSFLNFKGSELAEILNTKLNAKLQSIEEEVQRLTKRKNEEKMNIMNLFDTEDFIEASLNRKFNGSSKNISTVFGAKNLGFRLVVMNPKTFSCSYHYHEKE